MNKDNIDMLKSLYKSASMGQLTLKTVMPEVTNYKLMQQLENQNTSYKKIRFDAGSQLLDASIQPEEPTAREKAMAVMKVKMDVSKDRSTSNIATMLILGSTMGIVNAMKATNEYDQAEAKVTTQAQSAIDIENKNISELVQFL